MTMTNPPPPPASAMGLVAERALLGLIAQWKTPLDFKKPPTFVRGANVWRGQCAEDLAAALSLSEEEREALARIDDCMEWESTDGDVVGNYNNADMKTLRAIIARVTNIGEVK